MDPQILSRVCREIYQKFPQVNGCKPSVTRQSTSSGAPNTYLLIFSSKNKGNPPISTLVRVVVNDQGKILKTSTSK